jgi:hypothetical protein
MAPEQPDDVATMGRRVAVDLGGSLCAQLAATSEARLREVTQQAAACQAPAGGLGVEVREQIIGERHHDLRHGVSIPGIAKCPR